MKSMTFTPYFKSSEHKNTNQNKTYGFVDQEYFYNQYRPNWDLAFVENALQQAGILKLSNGQWSGTLNGEFPVVVSIGAGTGSDAAMFKKIGCEVILVEPNRKFIEIAKEKLTLIREGKAIFLNADAMNADIPPGTVDLIVVAQALHTLKHVFSNQYIPILHKEMNQGTEELSRVHWKNLLPNDNRSRISIWYYNPEPRNPIVRNLHHLLIEHCPRYRESKTPLLNAEFFEPNHFQPWIAKESLNVSVPIPIQTVSLQRDQIGEWLGSYSFKPNDDECEQVIKILQEQWFDRFQQHGYICIDYIGFLAQGPLRSDPFPMSTIDQSIGINSPLYYPLSLSKARL